VYLLLVWLHLVAAAVWVGGMVFLVLVVVPITRRLEPRGLAVSLIAQSGRRFRRVGWGCLGILLVSGAFNLGSRGFGWEDVVSGHIFTGAFGHVLGMKLLLVFIALVLSAVHDFFVGPRATAAAQAAPGSPEATRLRRWASWLGRLNLLLALAAIALAVTLVRG
jgi:putative copper resistance protein D